jgi:diguanylate cyclase (GGDEF)-like protein
MLRAALDEIEQGVALLDPMLNTQFLNRAVRTLWGISDEQANRKPPYIELVSDSRKTGAFDVKPEELEEFIAGRLAIARAGDPTPMDIPHADGRIIRSQCAALPGGGRMLTYSDVTDLVHRAAQFEELAAVDSLTGVYNRRQFNILANAEWSRFQRYYRPLSALVLDIDRFKQINDRHGHEVGDRAIVHVAMACKANRRSSDILCRLGGDEFAILLPETNLAQGYAFAERLRKTISQRPMRSYDECGSDVLLRASIGIAEATVSMPGVEALIKLADKGLYRAKTAGRNCTMSIDAQEGEERRTPPNRINAANAGISLATPPSSRVSLRSTRATRPRRPCERSGAADDRLDLRPCFRSRGGHQVNVFRIDVVANAGEALARLGVLQPARSP